MMCDMSFLLKQIYSFIQLLNSDTGATSIAAGITCGMILGFSPALSIQSLLVFILLFLLRIQIGAALLTAGLFALLGVILDPVFDRVGGAILETDALRGLFTNLYNLPLVPMTRFNNSVVMGAGVIALLLSPVVFLLSLRLVAAYRQQIRARIQSTRAYQAYQKWLQASGYYAYYQKFKKLEKLRG
jgi:uncharacterized protein (TIGR03546 family)